MQPVTIQWETSVSIYVAAQCPCGKKVQTLVKLSPVELKNTQLTDYVNRQVTAAKQTIEEEVKRRGWSTEMCGTCRDSDA